MNTNILIFLGLMLGGPLLAVIINFISLKTKISTAQFASFLIGLSLASSVCLLLLPFNTQDISTDDLLEINSLNTLLCCLILFVSFVVHRFSLRYMDGDRLYQRFFTLLSMLTLSAVLMVMADNLILFAICWILSNLFLVLLMIHKDEWSASKKSGSLAFNQLMLGSLLLVIGFLGLGLSAQSFSIDFIISQPLLENETLILCSLFLIMCAAMMQSALWPFNRWLLSSLNSPTPVSALMHAGLVNAGGILIIKFAPLMLMHPKMLTLLFLLGCISAILGTFFKLMQYDIKKMLACSTLAQMGFMMMQCSLGLFAAAITHLCWHGFFKAYLFLNSGSALNQPKANPQEKMSPYLLFIAPLGGLFATLAFIKVTGKAFFLGDAGTFVLFFSFIAGTQVVLTWLKENASLNQIIVALCVATFTGFIYGLSVHMIELLVPDLTSLAPVHLSLLHGLMLFTFGVLWLAFNLGASQYLENSKLGCRIYMTLLNASRPSAQTITSIRKDYLY